MKVLYEKVFSDYCNNLPAALRGPEGKVSYDASQERFAGRGSIGTEIFIVNAKLVGIVLSMGTTGVEVDGRDGEVFVTRMSSITVGISL
jgi:hypothetical protein